MVSEGIGLSLGLNFEQSAAASHVREASIKGVCSVSRRAVRRYPCRLVSISYNTSLLLRRQHGFKSRRGRQHLFSSLRAATHFPAGTKRHHSVQDSMSQFQQSRVFSNISSNFSWAQKGTIQRSVQPVAAGAHLPTQQLHSELFASAASPLESTCPV